MYLAFVRGVIPSSALRCISCIAFHSSRRARSSAMYWAECPAPGRLTVCRHARPCPFRMRSASLWRLVTEVGLRQRGARSRRGRAWPRRDAGRPRRRGRTAATLIGPLGEQARPSQGSWSPRRPLKVLMFSFDDQQGAQAALGLEMPAAHRRPAVLCWCGVSPSQAAKPRPGGRPAHRAARRHSRWRRAGRRRGSPPAGGHALSRTPGPCAAPRPRRRRRALANPGQARQGGMRRAGRLGRGSCSSKPRRPRGPRAVTKPNSAKRAQRIGCHGALANEKVPRPGQRHHRLLLDPFTARNGMLGRGSPLRSPRRRCVVLAALHIGLT